MKSSQIIIETPLVFMIVCLLMVILFSHGLAAEAKSEKIDKIVIEYFKNHQLNGVVLVAEKVNIIYRKAYGYADFGWAVKNRMDTKFRRTLLKRISVKAPCSNLARNSATAGSADIQFLEP